MSVLQAENVKRVFKYTANGHTVELEDINPNLSFKEVVKFYAGQYPEFTTATVTGPVMKEDQMIFSINTSAGVLG